MKFKKNPRIGRVRKRFAWLPRRHLELRQKWFSLPGYPPVPYTQGWNQGFGSGNNGPASSGYRNIARAPIKYLGGMVQPVENRTVNVTDCWIWLEYYLERYEHDYGENVKWTLFQLPEQWNLWHEYEEA